MPAPHRTATTTVRLDNDKLSPPESALLTKKTTFSHEANVYTLQLCFFQAFFCVFWLCVGRFWFFLLLLWSSFKMADPDNDSDTPVDDFIADNWPNRADFDGDADDWQSDISVSSAWSDETEILSDYDHVDLLLSSLPGYRILLITTQPTMSSSRSVCHVECV